MGPIWVLSAPDGSHVGPMNFAIWEAFTWANIDQYLWHHIALLGHNGLSYLSLVGESSDVWMETLHNIFLKEHISNFKEYLLRNLSS